MELISSRCMVSTGLVTVMLVGIICPFADAWWINLSGLKPIPRCIDGISQKVVRPNLSIIHDQSQHRHNTRITSESKTLLLSSSSGIENAGRKEAYQSRWTPQRQQQQQTPATDFSYMNNNSWDTKTTESGLENIVPEIATLKRVDEPFDQPQQQQLNPEMSREPELWNPFQDFEDEQAQQYVELRKEIDAVAFDQAQEYIKQKQQLKSTAMDQAQKYVEQAQKLRGEVDVLLSSRPPQIGTPVPTSSMYEEGKRKTFDPYAGFTDVNMWDFAARQTQASSSSTPKKVEVVVERYIPTVSPEGAKDAWLNYVWSDGGGLPTLVSTSAVKFTQTKENADGSGDYPLKRTLIPSFLEEELFYVEDDMIQYLASNMGVLMGIDLVAGSHQGKVEFHRESLDGGVTDMTRMVWTITYETKARTKMWKEITTMSMNNAADNLISYLAEPKTISHSERLPQGVTPSKAMESWLDLVWKKGGGLLPPFSVDDTTRIIVPPFLKERLISVDNEMNEITYTVENPSIWNAHPVHSHLGRVSFQEVQDSSYQDGSTNMQWDVQLRPYHNCDKYMQAYTSIVVKTLAQNFRIDLEKPDSISSGAPFSALGLLVANAIEEVSGFESSKVKNAIDKIQNAFSEATANVQGSDWVKESMNEADTELFKMNVKSQVQATRKNRNDADKLVIGTKDGEDSPFYIGEVPSTMGQQHDDSFQQHAGTPAGGATGAGGGGGGTNPFWYSTEPTSFTGNSEDWISPPPPPQASNSNGEAVPTTKKSYSPFGGGATPSWKQPQTPTASSSTNNNEISHPEFYLNVQQKEQHHQHYNNDTGSAPPPPPKKSYSPFQSHKK